MRSLQTHLSIGLIVSLLVVILLSWITLSNTIRYVAEDYILSRLQHDNEMLLAALDFASSQKPTLVTDRINAEYQQAFSGHYYLINSATTQLRSRSLWDAEFKIPDLTSGQSRKLRLEGPQQQKLLALVIGYNKQGQDVTIAVAEDLSGIEADILVFQQRFTITAVIVLLILVGIQLIIVRTALHPLNEVRREIRALDHGELNQLSQNVPAEISPLVQEVNHLLKVLDQRLQRSRNAVGNLAHALKKPLTVLQQLRWPESVDDKIKAEEALNIQTQEMQQLIERELRRARIAGEGPTGSHFVATNEIPSLVNTLHSIYHQKRLSIETNISQNLVIPVDREDALELLGVLLDNACKWASKVVRLTINCDNQITVKIEDDGPGVSNTLVTELTQRGTRLDESVTGYGLGLSIAEDIIQQYHGVLELGQSEELGGFCVTAVLPIDKATLSYTET
jgi:signal transduction histidine kinase